MAGLVVWRIAKNPAHLAENLTITSQIMPTASDTIDPNTASWVSLSRLPGIGPTRAKAICAYRDAFVASDQTPLAFATAADLMNVDGIGPTTAQRLEPLE